MSDSTAMFTLQVKVAPVWYLYMTQILSAWTETKLVLHFHTLILDHVEIVTEVQSLSLTGIWQV